MRPRNRKEYTASGFRGNSILTRPFTINSREEFGHWGRSCRRYQGRNQWSIHHPCLTNDEILLDAAVKGQEVRDGVRGAERLQEEPSDIQSGLQVNRI